VDISSGEEPACQKDSAPEAPEDFLAPVSALVSLQDPHPKALEGPTALIDALVAPQGLQESVVASSTANLPLKGARLQEPTTASSAVTPPSERVNPQEPTVASPAINVPPPEGTHPQEPITTSSVVATPPRTGMFYHQIIFVLFYAALLTCLPSGHEPLGIACI
jgi:hypothetical protein